jgi:predicted nucleotidyltransferase
MGRFGIDATIGLPAHDALLDAILAFFQGNPSVIGGFVSGSTARGGMDVDSDLDIGIVFESADARAAAWASRWDWQLAGWFHRFDADHIKPHFIIYLFEVARFAVAETSTAKRAVAIRADIHLYLVDELPPVEGGPYVLAWDDTGALQAWLDALPARAPEAPDWSAAPHEDERFWAWLVYLYNHVHRGEYYHCAYGFPELRDILEQWAARLGGRARFGVRRLESTPWAKRLLDSDLFPGPNRASLKACMLAAIELQLELRSEIETLGVAWTTEPGAIPVVTRLVESL